jgi:hypothetical protein
MKKKIKINNWVTFKTDIEQTGKVVQIYKEGKNMMYTLSSDDTYGFDGDYLNGETLVQIEAKKCWLFEDESYEC